MKKLALILTIIILVACEKDKEFSYNPKVDTFSDYKSEYSRIIHGCNKNLVKIDSTFLMANLELALDNFEGLWGSLDILRNKGIELLDKNTLEPTRTKQLNTLIDLTSDTVQYYKQKQANLDAVVAEDIELFIHFNQVVDFIRKPNYSKQSAASVAESSSAYLQNSPGFNVLQHFSDRPDHAIINYFTSNIHTAKTKVFPLASATLKAYELRAVWSILYSNGKLIDNLLNEVSSIPELEKMYNICVKNGMYMVSEQVNLPFDTMLDFASKSKDLLEVHTEYNTWLNYYYDLNSKPQDLIDDATALKASAASVSNNTMGITAFESYISEYKPNFNYLHYMSEKPALIGNWQINSSAIISTISDLYEATKDSVQIKNTQTVQDIVAQNEMSKTLISTYENETPNISYFFNTTYFDLYEDSAITDNTGWKLIQLKGKAGIQD